MYTLKITYLFIIYNLITFLFSYISISVDSILFNFCYSSYIFVIFYSFCVIPMYVCTIMHVCTMSVLSSALEAPVIRTNSLCVNILVIKLF